MLEFQSLLLLVSIFSYLTLGNDYLDACQSSPSAVEKAITVGATTITDTFADYSNYGSCVDILAPGKLSV
jgi:subtilisin family serine protease